MTKTVLHEAETLVVDQNSIDAIDINLTEYQSNWALDYIGAREAWGQSTGNGVIVAVLDTGIDVTHRDLDDNIWVNADEIAGDGIDNDGNGFIDDIHGVNFSSSGPSTEVMDKHSHGTHVAGIIAAEANGSGVIGVAPDAEVMAVKVLRDNGSGSWSDIAAGIHYAIDNGAKIINMSLGGSSLASAVAQAVSAARDAGVIIVAAAGNNGRDQASNPASLTAQFDNVISVAASTKSGTIAGFSNYSIDGTTVDVAAPGSSLRSTTPNDKYGGKSGTSMAAPVVAGAAAVLWAANPELRYDEVISIIESTVTGLANLAKPIATNGIINLAEAIKLIDPDLPVNEAPSLGINALVAALEENTEGAGQIRLADVIVTDDGVGVTVLELVGGDISAFEIREDGLYLRAGVTLDFETKAAYTVDIAVDDPALGAGYEDVVTFTLQVTDVDETVLPDDPSPDPELTPDAFENLDFWFAVDDAAYGMQTVLRDLSGAGHDAKARVTSEAAVAEDGRLRFDGTDVYRIADSTAINIGSQYVGKTLTFAIGLGDDITSQQVLYEQGGTLRGLSVYLENGKIFMAGWNLREQVWGVEAVSVDVSAGDTHVLSLVHDAEAGTLTGYIDGAMFGEADGVGVLHTHGDDVGLGGVRGHSLDAAGQRLAGDAKWTGDVMEVAGHGQALTASEIAALHNGMATAPIEPPVDDTPVDDTPPPPPPSNTGPVAVDDGPFNVGLGRSIDLDIADILSNDSDADGDLLSFDQIVSVSGGVASIASDVLTFMAESAGNGAVAYRITDGNGGFDEAVISFAIEAAPPADPGYDMARLIDAALDNRFGLNDGTVAEFIARSATSITVRTDDPTNGQKTEVVFTGSDAQDAMQAHADRYDALEDRINFNKHIQVRHHHTETSKEIWFGGSAWNVDLGDGRVLMDMTGARFENNDVDDFIFHVLSNDAENLGDLALVGGGQLGDDFVTISVENEQVSGVDHLILEGLLVEQIINDFYI